MQHSSKEKPRTALITFFSVLILIIIIDACRKIDYNRNKIQSIDADHTEKFFTIPANTDPRVKTVSESIKRQDDAAHFVNKLAEKVGYPVWNKALIVSPQSAHSRNQIDIWQE